MIDIRSVTTFISGDLLRADSLKAYVLAIKGLNLEQAKTVLSTRVLTDAQKEQILTEAGLMTLTEEQSLVMKEKLATTVATMAVQQKQALEELGLLNLQTGEILVNKALNKEKVISALTSTGVAAGEAEEIATRLVNIGAISGETVATNLLTKAKLGLAAVTSTQIGSIGLMVTVAVALMAAIYKIKKAIEVTADKAYDKAKETTDSINSLKTELDSIETELSNVGDRIDELEAKDNLSFVEQEELDKLRETNDELERQQAIKNAAITKEEKTAQKDAQNFFNSKVDGVKTTTYSEGVQETEQLDYVSAVQERLNLIEQYQSEIYNLKQEQSLLNDVNSTEYKKIQTKIDNMQLSIQTFKEFTDDAVEQFMEIDDSLIEGVDDSLLSQLSGLYNKYDALFANAFTDLNNDNKRYRLTSNLIQSGETEQNAQAIVDNLKDEELDLAWSIPITFEKPDSNDTEKYAGEYADLWVRTVKEEVGNNNVSMGNILLDESDALSKFTSSVKTAYDAYSTLMSGNNTSIEILDNIQNINNAMSDLGTNINWDFLDRCNNKAAILGKTIDIVSKEYVESFLSDNGIDPDSEFGQMLSNCIIQTQKAESALSSLNTEIDDMQSAYSSLTEIVSDYNSTGYITFDQLQTLLEMNPQYLSCLVDENGQLQINKQAMLDMANLRLNDAEAQAVQQAITELGNLALQDETTAINDSAAAFESSVGKISKYNQELANTFATASVASSSIRDLYAAMTGAEENGASKDQIDTVLNNLNTKLKLIQNTRTNASKSLDNIMSGSSSGSSSEPDYKSELDDKLKILKESLDKGEILYDDYYKQYLALVQKYYDEGKIESDDYYSYNKELLDDYIEDSENLIDNLYKKQDGTYNAGINSFKDYLQKRLDMIESYYAQGKISADDYYDYLDNYYTYTLGLYDRAISAVTKVLDDQIDSLNDQKDNLEDYYNNLINDLEDEKEALEKANEEREKAIDLQKAQYELNRAQNQRVNYAYEGGQFVYKADDTSIKDAKNELDDLEYQNKIDAIQDKIDALNDTLDEQTDAIQKSIDSLNEYKDKWSEVADKFSDAQDRIYADELLGADWENQVLAQRDDVLNNFTNDYVGLCQAQADNAIMSSSNIISSTDGITGSLDNVVGALDRVTSSAANAVDTLTKAFNNDALAPVTEGVNSLSQANDYLKMHIEDVTTALNNNSSSTTNWSGIQQSAVTSYLNLLQQLSDGKISLSEFNKIMDMSIGGTDSLAQRVRDSGIPLNNMNGYVATLGQVLDEASQREGDNIEGLEELSSLINDEAKDSVLDFADSVKALAQKFNDSQNAGQLVINKINEILSNNGKTSTITTIFKEITEKSTRIAKVGGVFKQGGVVHGYSKGGTVQGFASGGTVKKVNTSSLDAMAKSLGEDTMVAVKHGERILTPVQNSYWEKWTDVIPNLIDLVNPLETLADNLIKTPDYSKLASSSLNNQSIELNIGDIVLHEVQDVDTLGKQIATRLPNVVLQAINRK